MKEINLKQLQGFDWDYSNQDKSWKKHGVLYTECEQIFFNELLLLNHDVKHSDTEARYFALGKTDQARRLFVVFTVRAKLIRVISAREMNKKERGFYEKI